MLRTRLVTAAVALPSLWLIVWTLPDALFAGFIMAVAAMGLLEYFTMALPGNAVERTAGLLWGLVIAGGVAAQEPKLWGAGLGLAVIGGLMFPLLHADDLPGAMHRLGLSLLGVLSVGFFAGRAFGRHPLAPAISPSKTVEGALGALAGAMVIATVCRLVFFAGLGSIEALVLGAVISVLAQFGDLCESALKRAFGAKDSGWIIPGHGGILDRLDSLLFPVVFTYYYAVLPRA